MSYVALLITYYPDESAFKNIYNLYKQINNLIIVDNSDTLIIFPKNLTKIPILRNFIFDQDTLIPKNYIKSMLEFKKAFENSKILIYAPNFIDINSKTYASFYKFSKFSIKKLKCKKRHIIFPTLVITSGILLKTKAIEKIGYFNEDYLIDQVDNEYCIRLWKSGFKIAVNFDIVLKHSIGKRSTRKILFLNVKPSNHNAFRRYLIARNSLITVKKYPYIPVFIWETKILFHEFLSILVFEKEKYKRLKFLLKGLKDGILY